MNVWQRDDIPNDVRQRIFQELRMQPEDMMLPSSIIISSGEKRILLCKIRVNETESLYLWTPLRPFVRRADPACANSDNITANYQILLATFAYALEHISGGASIGRITSDLRRANFKCSNTVPSSWNPTPRESGERAHIRV